MYEQSQMRIHPVSAIMRETPEQPNMFIRSFETNGTGHAINSIMEATQNGSQLNPILLSPVAGNFLNLAPMVSNGAQIAGGWRTKRFRFVLNFKSHKTINGDYFSFYATGYTDIFDMSFGNNISPDTKLFFNNIVTHRHSIERDQQTNIPFERETRSSEIQIISKNSMTGEVMMQEVMPGANSYIRPADVFRNACTHMETMDSLGVGYPIINGNSSTPVSITNRNNNNPVNYLGKTLKALREASMETITDGNSLAGLGGRNDMATDMLHSSVNTAMKTLTEPGKDSNLLTSILFGFPKFCTHGFLVWRELLSLWPELDRQLNINLIPSLKEIKMNPLDSDNWQGGGFEHILATSMITHLPTLMIERSIGIISFNATNRFRHQGLVDFDPIIFMFTESAMISNVVVPAMTLENLKNRIIHEIVMPLTAQGQMDFDINCSINLIGNSYIEISLNGSQQRVFSAPQFADNLFTPLLSGNSSKLNEISMDFISLASNMNSNMGAGMNGVHHAGFTQMGMQRPMPIQQVGNIPQPQFATAVSKSSDGFY